MSDQLNKEYEGTEFWNKSSVPIGGITGLCGGGSPIFNKEHIFCFVGRKRFLSRRIKVRVSSIYYAFSITFRTISENDGNVESFIRSF